MNLLLAIQFLTIMPVKITGTIDKDDIMKSSRYFVLVGFMQGALLFCMSYLFKKIFYPDIANLLIILIYVISNGGFHIDGLSDTFDALAAKSEIDKTSDIKKRLAIMKESSAGPIGVVAIIFTLAIKYLCLNNIYYHSPVVYSIFLLALPMFSKWAMVVSMFHGKSARETGLGSIFISKIGFKEIGFSTVFLFVIPLICIFLNNYFYSYFYIIVIALIYFICGILNKLFNSKFGGLTGDTLGAMSEITEITVLLTGIICVKLFI